MEEEPKNISRSTIFPKGLVEDLQKHFGDALARICEDVDTILQLQQENKLNSARHLVGHLMREGERIVRDKAFKASIGILRFNVSKNDRRSSAQTLEFIDLQLDQYKKETVRSGKKNNHSRQIEIALASMPIENVPKEHIKKTWLDCKDLSLPKEAHLPLNGKLKSLDLDFRDRISTWITFLVAMNEFMIAGFSKYFAQIDQYANKPNAQNYDRLSYLPPSPILMTRLYDKGALGWAKVLHEKGVFKQSAEEYDGGIWGPELLLRRLSENMTDQNFDLANTILKQVQPLNRTPSFQTALLRLIQEFPVQWTIRMMDIVENIHDA